MTRLPCLLALAAATTALAPPICEAQLPRLVKERVQEKVEERKRQTRDNLVERAAEPADSALERVMSPVDSAAARAGGHAGAAVARVGRVPDPVAEEEAAILARLESGRAEVHGVTFEPDTDVLTAGSAPALAALARIVGGEMSVFLIQGRAGPGTAAESRQLAELRAVAVKNWLVGNGVPAERVFAAADGTADSARAVVGLVRMQ